MTDGLRQSEKLARARGLAEAIAKATPYPPNIDGVRDVAAEIVDLLSGVTIAPDEIAPRVAVTLDDAIIQVDKRFRALAGVGEDEAMVMLAERSNFRPLLLGLPVDAGEAIDWIGEATRRAIMLAGAGNEPDAALFGALLAAFMTGALVRDGD